MKTNSSGILILNEFNQILVCHVTGQNFWDLPKGKMELNESPIQTAIRECKEECSLIFSESDLEDLGLFAYNKYKNLYLFKAKVRFDWIELDKLVCVAKFYDENKKMFIYEMDNYKWIHLNEIEKYCTESMIKVLHKVKKML
jgi:8-oxo-dGTP pyrophosphatase MutT (NUDIX family)